MNFYQNRLLLSLILLSSILLLSTSLISEIHIPAGKVSGVWYKDKSPYHVDGEIRIAYGDTLVIQPGVEVIFSAHYKFEVYGTLEAVGTPEDSILFTAGNMDQRWGGIRFNDTETESILQYCLIEYGWAKVSKDSNEVFYGKHPYNRPDLTYMAGGGIFLYYADVTIKNVTIRYCQAEFAAGGIWCEYSTAKVENCKIYENSAKEGAGAISVWFESNIELLKCNIENNVGLAVGGLKITLSNAEVKNCIIKNNTGLTGGGIYITESDFTISSSIIVDNQANQGGGIFIENSTTTLKDLKIINNSARKNGGGMQIISRSAAFSNVAIINNKAGHYGGGIYFHTNELGFQFDTLKLNNIYLNTAGLGGNDLFSTFFSKSKSIVVDTFTVLNPNENCIEPAKDFDITIKNYKIKQVKADLYVNPEGSNRNTGLSASEPLKTIKFALIKILSDSLNPLNIHLSEGIYSLASNGESLPIKLQKHVSLVSDSRADITWTADSIIVSIPWWNTNPAIISFIIIGILLIISLWQFQLRRIRIDHELEQQRFAAQKLKEVDQLKSRFFANISHEFRTPLTLMIGPLEQMLSGKFTGNFKEQYQMMLRNGQRLLALINQLLDIARLESGRMTLQAAEGDITDFLKKIAAAFESLAARKKIDFSFQASESPLLVYFDRDKLEKIVINLLSNAFKFSEQGDAVAISVRAISDSPKGQVGIGISEKTGQSQFRHPKSEISDFVEITIKDTGIGIPPERLSHIFDRFYQVDDTHTRVQEGSGIGLALAKELVTLHHGEILAESTLGKGSTFIVCLPLGKAHLEPHEILEEAISESPKGQVGIPKGAGRNSELNNFSEMGITESQDKQVSKEDRLAIGVGKQPATNNPEGTGEQRILIVEDNADMRAYLRENLAERYMVIEAENGEEGLKQGIKQMPDLIISDVMMPKMDGYELCHKLKSDARTSHIPVVLLTARADAESKIEGLETGADDYLAKPFDVRELRVRVKNLIAQRRKLWESFRQGNIVAFQEFPLTSLDTQLLERAIEIVERHIADSDFSTDTFGKALGLSRSQLHRKLSALTGQSAHQFIRTLRLKRAAQLLQHHAGNVSDIAYQVGFNSLSHFAKVFREMYNMSPSAYAARHSDE